MKLNFIGVWMAPECGETVSFVIELDTGEKIMIDTAVNPIPNMLKMGVNPLHINDLILTHTHGDHMSGLPMLLFYRINYLSLLGKNETSKIRIIGSKECIENAMEYLRIPYPGLASSNRFEKFTMDSLPYVLKYNERYELTFFASKHLPLTTGFVLKDLILNKKIVYTGDSALSEEVLEYARDANCLIHDVAATNKFSMLSKGHCLAEELVSVLENYNIKLLIPVHRLPYYKDNANEYFQSFSKLNNVKLYIPNDIDIIEI